MAAPFVEGQLRNSRLAVEVETNCASSGRALHLTFDSDLNWSVRESDAHPLVFEPDVDWSQFQKPVIIHDY